MASAEANDPYRSLRLVQMSIRNAAGEMVFEETDLPLLADMNEPDLRPLIEAAYLVNGYGPVAQAQLAKNSAPTAAAAS